MPSTKEDVQKFFDEYVFGFIFSDIQREINLARSGRNAGNLLSALGLLCYTEFMGGFLRRDWEKGLGENFDCFFKKMGSCYASFLGKCNVYKNSDVDGAHVPCQKELRHIHVEKATFIWIGRTF